MNNFQYKKAVQLINFFTHKEGGEINRLKAVKLVWLADRLHLRQHYRLITEDTYYAMPRGPVPSNTLNLLKEGRGLTNEQFEYAQEIIQKKGNFTYTTKKSVYKKIFSITDCIAMEAVYEQFGILDKYQLSELSHTYPEWKRHEQTLKTKETGRFKIDILDFFKNPITPTIESVLFDQSFDDLQLTKELYLEEQALYNFL
ncbi:MAG: Panacea domain-containing protein [Aureispira sp.]